jgi:hypothetical protein
LLLLLGCVRVYVVICRHARYEAGIGKECQQEIIFDQITRAASYDNIDMAACAKTAQSLCADELLANAAAETAALAAGTKAGADSKLAAMTSAAGAAARAKAARDRVVRCLADSSMEAVGATAVALGEPACADEVFREVRERSEDIRFAPDTNAACEGDMTRLCADVKPGRGRVRACVHACDARGLRARGHAIGLLLLLLLGGR